MQNKTTRLQQVATRLRLLIVKAHYEAQSGHCASALSIADVVAVLYFDEMRFGEEQRDRLVLSKGHSVTVVYAAFAELGWLDDDELMTLRKVDSRLQGHPDRTRLPSLDAGTGALGQGPSIAIGYALACRLRGDGRRIYCIIGDGECQEGQIWEAAMYASANCLDNLVLILDRNGLQNEYSVEQTLPMGHLVEKWRSFGWNTIEIDGHDIHQILNGLSDARAARGGPSIMIAETVKGKGVDFMENNNDWHSKAIGEEDYRRAIESLERLTSWDGAGARSC